MVSKNSISTANSKMDTLVRENWLMIDTCSLMVPSCPGVIDQMIPALQRHGKKLIVPQRVIEELQKHHRNSNDPERAKLAGLGLSCCARLKKASCLDVRGADTDHFADNAIYVALSRYHYNYQMLLITQDKALARDVLQLNRNTLVPGKPVSVMYITARGELRKSDL